MSKKISLILGGVLLTSQGYAKSSTESLALKIIDIRSKIEVMQTELATEKEKSKALINSALLKNQELENEYNDLSSIITEAKTAEKELTSSISKSGTNLGTLMPVFTSECNKTAAYVDASLPYKKDARKKELNKICSEDILSQKAPLTAESIYKLWSFLEDENRLASEINMATIKVSFNGETILAEAVKIGNYGLYAKTPEDKYLTFNNDAKTFTASTKEEEKLVRNIIVNLKRNVRTGPVALPIKDVVKKAAI